MLGCGGKIGRLGLGASRNPTAHLIGSGVSYSSGASSEHCGKVNMHGENLLWRSDKIATNILTRTLS
jgi:hypothetical protein